MNSREHHGLPYPGKTATIRWKGLKEYRMPLEEILDIVQSNNDIVSKILEILEKDAEIFVVSKRGPKAE
jgi:hypothetical protein